MELVRITRVEYKGLVVGVAAAEAVEEADGEGSGDDEGQETDCNHEHDSYMARVTSAKCDSV